MALILAINPGNSHSPTLARVARELQGCELVGAESCAVAIRAIDERVPDLVLLPASPARGEEDLLARLLMVPGGVPTLKLPPPALADPLALAAEIRGQLTGSAPPARPPATSPHLIAAATAAIKWIQARRVQWVTEDRPSSIGHRPSAIVDRSSAILDRSSSSGDRPSAGGEPAAGTYDEQPIPSNDDRSPFDDERPTIDDGRSLLDDGRSKRWLPYAAAAIGLVAVAVALIVFWPRSSQSIGTTGAPAATAVEPASRAVEPRPEAPAATPPASPVPSAIPDAAVSGWIAVFAPFDVTISEGTAAVVLDDRNRAMLPPGRHRLRFQNAQVGYDETRTVTVQPTDTTTINLTPQTAITVTSNEPGEVLIDGTRAGETPFEGRVTLGAHTVTVRTARGERQFAVDATSKPIVLEADFSRP